MQQEGNEPVGRPRRSTRDYVVNEQRAEILAGHFGGIFEAPDIRENLGGEPVKKALGLLEWAARKPHPLEALQNKAKKDGLGHHRPRPRPGPARSRRSGNSDASEEYRRYMAFVERKQKESLKQRGRHLFPRELEDLAQEFYAPEYRADLAKISPEAWDAFHRELEEDEGVA